MKLPDTYQNAVACGELQPDPAQEAALCALERLRLDLSRPRKRGWFRKGRACARWDLPLGRRGAW